jgi:magnesium and cobalt transporter
VSEPAHITQSNETEDRRPGFLKSLRKLFAPANGDAASVREVIEELIEERIEENPEGAGTIDPNERLLLSNVLRLRDVTARDIMVPRADIVAIEINTSLPDALMLLVKEQHSRLPVYRETLDDVVGLVHIKDVAVVAAQNMGALPVGGGPKQLGDMVRDLLFVSPAVRVLDLLLEMRLKHTHMALVVDEFGGIDGMVTIEDVVEQIVGEIEDEHDSDETPSLEVDASGVVVADARVLLTDFENRVGQVFNDDEREENDTLGGLVISLAGRVPGRGALVKHPTGIEFEVMESDPRRVRQLRVRGIPQPSGK